MSTKNCECANTKNKYQAEDDLQEEIEELEIKLMRSNAVKEELDGIHLKMEKM